MMPNDQIIISHSCKFNEENKMSHKIAIRGQSMLRYSGQGTSPCKNWGREQRWDWKGRQESRSYRVL